MFAISKDKTPILAQQSSEVQELAVKFSTEYSSTKSVAVRLAWGELLHKIRNSPLKCVDAEGQDVEGSPEKDAASLTFESIVRELRLPRSTAYVYLNEYFVSKTYPQQIQEAARDAGLNLSLDHVRSAYDAMVAREPLPQQLNALEARGVVAELADKKPDKKPRSTVSPEKQVAELLKQAFKLAKEANISFAKVGQLTVAGLEEADFKELDALKAAGKPLWLAAEGPVEMARGV